MALHLDPILLDVLACPADHHAPLLPGSPSNPRAEALTCGECGRIYPVRDGIPVLLLEDATFAGDVTAPDGVAPEAPESGGAP